MCPVLFFLSYSYPKGYNGFLDPDASVMVDWKKEKLFIALFQLQSTNSGIGIR
jgi:hypothetical protein